MATILEGLNQIAEAVGGTAEAESNLEALNAIAGALGGETNATNNADAIDQIAEHASGGGGGDFSTATVTITVDTTETTTAELMLYNVVHIEDGFAFIGEESAVNSDNGSYDVILYQNKCVLDDSGESVLSAEGSAEQIEGGYLIKGDCQLTVKQKSFS